MDEPPGYFFALRGDGEPSEWSRRYKANIARLRSRDPREVRRVILSLEERERTKGLSQGELRMLDRAIELRAELGASSVGRRAWDHERRMFERFANRVRRVSVSNARPSIADLTDRARRVLLLAGEEARLLNHNFIGTEHILLALIHEGEGVAAIALGSLGIGLDAVRAKVEESIGPAGPSTTGSMPFTPRAKKVLELSRREARQLGHKSIGTEHMLLGLVREGEGVAVQVLISLGVDLSRVRVRVMEVLSGYQPDDHGGSSPNLPLATWRSNRRAAPRCSVCRASLTESLAYQIVDVRGPVAASLKTVAVDNADGDDPAVRVALVYCTSCGTTIGSHDPPDASGVPA